MYFALTFENTIKDEITLIQCFIDFTERTFFNGFERTLNVIRMFAVNCSFLTYKKNYFRLSKIQLYYS